MAENREISAGIVIYRRTKDGPRFLLMYNGYGHWSFPKGKLEAGERGIQAAFREVSEETGIPGKSLVLKNDFREINKYVFLKNGKRYFKIVILFLAETRSSEVKVSSEHEGYGWFLYKDAVRVLKFTGIKDILKMADSFLKRR